MTDTRWVACELKWDRALSPEVKVSYLRGAIGNLFPDDPLFHQHQDQRLLYRYPLIQYKMCEGRSWVVGWGEGADVLLRSPLVGQDLLLDGRCYRVVDQVFEQGEHDFVSLGSLCRYRFVTPLLLFKQENYREYCSMPPWRQAEERDRLARASILMSLRGLDVEIDWQLYAALEQFDTVACSFKRTTFHGIFGTLVTNIALPEHFAIGKKVSHGYGWLTRLGGES